MIYLIKNGHVVSPANDIDGRYDILIEDDRILSVDEKCDPDTDLKIDDVIDALGLVIFPGLIDPHCHLRTPGQEYKEDIETGTKAAAKGGFTSVACMPNTVPAADNASIIEYIIKKAKEDARVNVYPIGAITKGLEGKELSEIGELKFSGAVAISDDGYPVRSADIMMKAMQYAAMFDISVISHCEDSDLSDGHMNEGYISALTGLKGIPSVSEEILVARELILAQYLGLPVHIAHVSSSLSVQLIREAKQRGAKVTCETCPHYFALTEEALLEYDTNAKVNPPLKTEADRLAIIEGIRDGTIDMLATDHAPHHIDEKNIEFQNALSGMIGFETAVPLAIDILHHANGIPLSRIAMMASVNPAALLSLNKGVIEAGKTADLTIIDIDRTHKIDVSRFESKSKNSPFDGFELKGSARYTIVSGKMVMRDGILL